MLVLAPGAYLDALLPNLILQPLVENAIQHGVSKMDGQGRIEMRAWRENEQLCLSVRDNGPSVGGDGSLKEGIGLSNTRARLQQLYGARCIGRLNRACSMPCFPT